MVVSGASEDGANVIVEAIVKMVDVVWRNVEMVVVKNGATER